MQAFLTTWAQQPVVWAITRVLMLSLWQIPLLGAVYLAVPMLTRRPQWRYVAGMVVLAAMVLVPLASEVAWLHPATVTATPAVVMSKMGEPMRVMAAGVQVEELGTRGTGWSIAMLRPVVALVWLAGIAYMALRFLHQYRCLRQIRLRAASPPDATNTLMGRLARALSVRTSIVIRVSADVAAPILVGVVRPVILVPVSLMTGGAPEILEAMIAHELAHIRRRDPLMNMVQILVENLLFYHPVMWLVSRHIRMLREMCTDELAAEVMGNRVGYARALSAMEELRDGTGQMALAATRGSLVVRIRHLVEPRIEARARWLPVMCAVILLGLPVVLVGVAACDRHEPVPPTTAASSTQGTNDSLVDAAAAALKKGELTPVVGFVTRVYDIREFLIAVRDWRQTSQQQVVELIQQSIVAESWKNANASIMAKDGLIVITQTAENHERIRVLLEQLSEARSIMMRLEFKLVLTRDQQLVEQLTPLQSEGKKPAKVKPIYDNDLLSMIKSSPGTSFISAPSVTQYNGSDSTVEMGTLRISAEKNLPAVSIDTRVAASADRSYVASGLKVSVNTAAAASGHQPDTRTLNGFAVTPNGQWCCVGALDVPTQNLLPEFTKEEDRPCTMLILERASIIQVREPKIPVWEKPEVAEVTTLREIREREKAHKALNDLRQGR